MSLRLAFDLDGVLADLESALAAEADRLFGPAPARDRSPASMERRVGAAERRTVRGRWRFLRFERRHGIADRRAAARHSRLPASLPASPTSNSTIETGGRRLSRAQHRLLWETVQQTHQFWEALPELFPGAVANLARLARARRWEVLFLTKRPETRGDTPQLQTQRWLDRQGFSFPSVFVVSGSRGAVAKALELDVVVDDRPEHCVDVLSDSGAYPMLVARPPTGPIQTRARRLGIGVVNSTHECLHVLEELDPEVQRSVLWDRLSARLRAPLPAARASFQPG